MENCCNKKLQDTLYKKSLQIIEKRGKIVTLKNSVTIFFLTYT